MGVDRLIQIVIDNNSDHEVKEVTPWTDSGRHVVTHVFYTALRVGECAIATFVDSTAKGVSGCLRAKIHGLEFAIAFSNPLAFGHKFTAAWTEDWKGLWDRLEECDYKMMLVPHGCTPKLETMVNGPLTMTVDCEAVEDFSAQMMFIRVKLENR